MPGASVAGIALEYRLNANLVRRWLKHAVHGKLGAVALRTKTTVAMDQDAFVPVMVEGAVPSAQQIRIEVRRGGSRINIEWPMQAAGHCAAWLREWLR